MAIATAYSSVNMDTATIWYGNVTIANASQLQVSSGGDVQNYYGTFSYGLDGSLTGGSVTSTNYYYNGSKVYEINSGTYSALTVKNYLDLGGRMYGLFSYVFSGNDTLTGSSGNDFIYGFTGNDVLNCGAGNDTLNGGLGNDIYYVDTVGDVITESSTLTTEIDKINSSITYTLGTDLENLTLTGTLAINGTGNALKNVLIGNAVANSLNGLMGNDNLNGASGNDNLNGGLGADILNGGLGADILNGGVGNDVLTGGMGKDVFIFNTALTATGIDKITDFTPIDDTIKLENAIFKALPITGILAANAFRTIGSDIILPTVINNDYRMVYNHDNGALSYDADGDGLIAAVQIALIGVTTHPALTNADFVVF